MNKITKVLAVVIMVAAFTLVGCKTKVDQANTDNAADTTAAPVADTTVSH